MTTRSEWVGRGRDAIMQLLATELVAPVIELEARICDRPWPGQAKAIDPHLLGLARRDLESAGVIKRTEAVTRGGTEVALVQVHPIPRGRTRATTDAAARKRLLLARWRSWSRANGAMPNLIGQGGEAVVHQSLLRAAPLGYRVVQPTRGEVATLYGAPVPGGPLDNAAWLTTMDQQIQIPTGTYLLPIEVKNVRHWLYPNHSEIYQLLHKSAGLAAAHPEHPILPILICRKAHYQARQLAKDLGFLIFDTGHQYVYPSERITDAHFQEVRAELGLEDLMVTNTANEALVKWFSGAPHTQAATYSARWMRFGPQHIDTFRELRRDDLRWPDRLTLMQHLHTAVEDTFGKAGSWASSEEPDDDDLYDYGDEIDSGDFD